MRPIRILALAITALLLASFPAIATHRTITSGTLTLTAPQPGEYSGSAYVRWRWTGGSTMRSKFVQVSTISDSGAVRIVALAVPIWHGRTAWNTANWADGRYRVQGVVGGTKPVLRSILSNVVVDNTKPAVEMTKPGDGDVVVNNTKINSLGPTVVAGPVTLTAATSDNLSGIEEIRILVDGEPVDGVTVACQDAGRLSCEGTASYEFGPSVGSHEISAETCDEAGNCSASEPVDITVAVSTDLSDGVCVEDDCMGGSADSAPASASGGEDAESCASGLCDLEDDLAVDPQELADAICDTAPVCLQPF